MPRALIENSPFPPIGPYSHAVRSGNMVFVSATPGVDPDTGDFTGADAHSQTAQALRNVIACVATAGGSEADIVSVQVNLCDVGDFAEMNRAYAGFFSAPLPARSVIAVAALPKSGALLTISAVAVLPAA